MQIEAKTIQRISRSNTSLIECRLSVYDKSLKIYSWHTYRVLKNITILHSVVLLVKKKDLFVLYFHERYIRIRTHAAAAKLLFYFLFAQWFQVLLTI